VRDMKGWSGVGRKNEGGVLLDKAQENIKKQARNSHAKAEKYEIGKTKKEELRGDNTMS